MTYSPDQILDIITAVISLASLIVATTNTPEPKGVYGTLYRILEMLALVTQRAKQNPKATKRQERE